MSFKRAQIVRSRCGRDSGRLFCVMDAQAGWLLLADGKRRRVDRPKRKQGKHVALVGEWDHPVMEKVRTGQSVRDRELRAALAAFREEMEV
ncbi:MAG TPA: KOW domain-containing RNA-binding protein [Candidatus Enterenecus stercoripullorum]|nr:KOW domain-containing RNA-binding protein [Candidatus Enterenecus stercoripullorum]